MHSLQLDHVPIGWSDLDEAAEEFERIGLETVYGGTHSSTDTHNSIVVFQDGTFIELISGSDPDTTPGFWPEAIEANAGPCAWCLEVDDVFDELRRILGHGIPVEGPENMYREEPNGRRPEWDLAFFGTDSHQQRLPFLAAGRTPRHYRDEPTGSVSDGTLTGISDVVVLVEDLQQSITQFRSLYRLPMPVRDEVEQFGAEVASIPAQPLTLAHPLEDNWLESRLEEHPPMPCSVLIGTDDFEKAQEAYPLGDPIDWLDSRVAWFESSLFNQQLGVVEN